MVKFDVTDEESAIVRKIVRRARKMAKADGIDYPENGISMDLIACHSNGCKLDLQTLLDAPDHTFGHDIYGIRRFLDRSTGKINPAQFDPRCSMPADGSIPSRAGMDNQYKRKWVTTGGIRERAYVTTYTTDGLDRESNGWRRKAAEIRYWRETVKKRGYLIRMSDGVRVPIHDPASFGMTNYNPRHFA